MIATAFLRALSQFGDGRFQRVLALGIGLTVALLQPLHGDPLGRILERRGVHEALIGHGANAEASGIIASRHAVAAPTAPLVRLLVVEVAGAAASGGTDILLSAVDSRRPSFIVRDDQRNKETLCSSQL